MNNIAEIEKSIKRFLKRSKSLSYSAGLLVAFLITGNLALTRQKSIQVTLQ